LIKTLVEGKSSRGEMTLGDRFLISTAELLGMDLEEAEEKKEEKK